MAGPFDSPHTAMGLPQKARMVESTVPATGPGEGAFFISDGSSGLNVGEPYFRPANNGTPINVLQGIPGPEDLAFTLLQGNFTGGSDIVVSNGDAITSEASGTGVPGRNLVLTPGTVVDTDPGALLWGTAYASAARGKAAIDMQFGRTAITQRVQPGCDYGVIMGGRQHTISTTFPLYGFGVGIFAGQGNTISGYNTKTSVILGGMNNTIHGAGLDNPVYASAIVGGINNTITGVGPFGTDSRSYFSFIGAGKSNYIGYNSYGSVCFGGNNTIHGGYFPGSDFWASYAICAGKNNIISGEDTVGGSYHSGCFGEGNTIRGSQDSFCFGRFNYVGGPNPAYGSCSMVGGHGNTIRSYASLMWGKSNVGHTRAHFGAAFGYRAYMYSAAMWVLGGGGSAAGAAQTAIYSRSIITTNATPTPLDNSSSRPRIFIAANRTFGFRMYVTARQTAGAAGTIGDSASWLITGCIKRDGANNTVLVGVPTGTGTPSAFSDAGAAAWTVSVTADDTNEALGVTVTGELNKTISWTISVFDAEAG